MQENKVYPNKRVFLVLLDTLSKRGHSAIMKEVHMLLWLRLFELGLTLIEDFKFTLLICQITYATCEYKNNVKGGEGEKNLI